MIPALGQTNTVQPRVGERADLALFGHLKSWNETGENALFSRKSGPPWTARFANFGVEWDEPRQIYEIRAAFSDQIPLESIHPEYWVSLSSDHPPGGGQGGWTLTDTPWNGNWKPAVGSAHFENGTWTFRSSANARHTLKVRLRFDGVSAPSLARFEVLGSSVWNIREVSLETGSEGKQATPLNVELYNGRVVSTRTDAKMTHLRVLYLEHFPDSSDGTVLTIRTPAASFGLAIDDLIQHKAIYIRDLGIFMTDGIAGASLESYLASGRLSPGNDIISRVSKQPEQSLERAMSEIPSLSMRDRSGRHPNRYIPVGVFASREKYGVEFNGNLFISKRGSKAFPEEQARMEWSGDELSYRIGTGQIPDFREREHSATQSVLDGYLPVILTDWTQNGLAFHEEAFATLLDSPLETWRIRGDEQSVLLAKLTITNTTPASCDARVWLYLNQPEKLALRNDVLAATGDRDGPYRQPHFRAVLKSSAGRFETATLPVESEYQGPAAVWDRDLAPNDSATITLAFTFRTLHEDAKLHHMLALDYEQERTRLINYWAGLTETGSQLHVPDELLNRFYRSALQHILLSVQRDVPTGLYMAPCGTYDYNMFANETDIQVRLLDMRGLPDFAAKFLEPFFALQGSKPFPGRFRQTDAILHGVRIDAEHDYTQSGYNLNHGWTLWTAAEHYLFTRDQDWLRAHIPKMTKAADWIVSERHTTMRTDENGQKVWEYGLLPPGQLEDNEEWQYWFAVNAYAYRGLLVASQAISGLDPVNGARLAEEAGRYREDIRNAAFRSMGAMPAVPLRDGTWIPALATRTHTHGRDVGWIRNILYGPQVLIDCGVLSEDEPAAGWILRDLEDNLFMSPESFSVAEQDWFSRGGITLQPNLVNTPVIYLARDQIPNALRAFYNAFAVSYYPDVNMFTEWEPSFGRSGGPFFKTSDEAAFLAWLRQMLVREQNDTLYLSSGAPRRWFRPGQRIEFLGAPTYFGKMSLTIESHSDQGYIDAVIEVPAAFRGKRVELRLRHPEGKAIAKIEIDGQPWTRFDPRHDAISVPVAAGTRRIRAYF